MSCTWCGEPVATGEGFRALEPAGARLATFCRLEHVVPWAIRGAYWEPAPGCNCVKNSAFPERKSPRIFPIPLYDPDYYDLGKQTGRVASLRTANWIGYFVERIDGSSQIFGRIIPIGGIRDKTYTTGTASMPKAIRLVQ